jgi:hypothetical protein
MGGLAPCARVPRSLQVLLAKDTLDREVSCIGIVPVLAAAQSPTLLQLFEHGTVAIYPLAHIGIHDIAAMLRPIDRKSDRMLRRIPSDPEATKAADRRPELNEIIEKSEELCGDRFIDGYLFAIAQCDSLAIARRSNWRTCFHIELAPNRSTALGVAIHMLGRLAVIR